MAYSTIPKGNLYFTPLLYNGNGSSQSLTTGFEPSLVWTKTRNQTENPAIFDAVRGVGNVLFTNSSSAENAGQTDGVTAFNSTGYSVGSFDGVNNSSANLVSWSWKANGQGSSNTDGSINTTYTSVNTTAGFSISSYTGTGSLATVGHGLGSAPGMIIIKDRSNTRDWAVYHQSMGNTSALYLNLTNDKSDSSAWWNNTSPTSNVFTINTRNEVNASSANMIAYCFAEKQGYSKFGSYTGNGITDGPFVYTGFKPAFIMTKETSGTSGWKIWDSKRPNGFNVITETLDASSSDDVRTYNADFLSNGVKLRTSTSFINESGQTYIYMAFAENPFVATSGTTALPVTAR